MFEGKRTKAEEREFTQLLATLNDQLADIDRLKQTMRLVPPGWESLEELAPVRPRKAKLTLALDADMVAWYRRLGRGYQPRMNAVLRAYMHAVVSREIERPGHKDWWGRTI